VQPWWIHATGGDSGSGLVYLELSGFLSIVLPLIVQLIVVALLWGWHNQCQVHHCYWPTRRKTAAGDRACWRHAPVRHMTYAQLCERHHLYLGKQVGKG
jgi:hypothetical protein